jgi:hypothetical protein
MVKENGKRNHYLMQQDVIVMKENMHLIKRMVREYLSGKVEINIKAIT